MSLLAHLAHLVKTNIRAARGVWVVWLVLVAVDVAWQIAAMREMHIAPTSSSATFYFLRTFLPLAQGAVLLMLVSTVVHADPVVDATAFWLTRPIPPLRMALGKLLTVFLLVIGPALVAETLLLLWLRVPLLYLARTNFELALALAVPTMFAFVAASITPHASRFIVLLLGLFTAAVVTGLLVNFFALWRRVPPPVSPIPVYSDPTRLLAVGLVAITGLLVVIGWHYHRRDWRLAAGGTLLVCAAAVLLTRYWPGISLFGAESTPEAAWTSPAVTRLRVADDRMRVTVGGVHGSHLVIMPVVMDGLPSDYTASPFTLRGELTYADGITVWSHRSPGVQMPASPVFHPSLMLSTYRGTPPASGPMTWEHWPAIIEIPKHVLDRKVDEPGRYTGTFYYRLARHARLATLPLTVGARHRDGPRSLSVLRVTDTRFRCRVLLEVTGPSLTFAGPHEPVLGYHFVDRHTGAYLRTVDVRPPGAYGGAFIVDPTLSARARMFGASYVEVAAEDLNPQPLTGAPALHACADTSLVVVRTTAAGALTRTLFLPELRISSPTDTPTRATRLQRSRS